MRECREDLTIDDVIELLEAKRDCINKWVRGLYDECRDDLCESCDLCYKKGTMGEQVSALDYAIKILKEQRYDGF